MAGSMWRWITPVNAALRQAARREVKSSGAVVRSGVPKVRCNGGNDAQAAPGAEAAVVLCAVGCGDSTAGSATPRRLQGQRMAHRPSEMRWLRLPISVT